MGVTGSGTEKAESVKDERGTVGGGGAIQGAEVEVETVRIVMVMSVAGGTAPAPVPKDEGMRLRTSPRRRRRRRQRRKTTGRIIQILRSQSRTGFGCL